MVEAYIKIISCAKCPHKSSTTTDVECDVMSGNLGGDLEDWYCVESDKIIVVGIDEYNQDCLIPSWCTLTKEKILNRTLNKKLKKIRNEKGT